MILSDRSKDSGTQQERGLTVPFGVPQRDGQLDFLDPPAIDDPEPFRLPDLVCHAGAPVHPVERQLLRWRVSLDPEMVPSERGVEVGVVGVGGKERVAHVLTRRDGTSSWVSATLDVARAGQAEDIPRAPRS